MSVYRVVVRGGRVSVTGRKRVNKREREREREREMYVHVMLCLSLPVLSGLTVGSICST